MKKILIIVFFLGASIMCSFAQHQIVLEKCNLLFESSEALAEYDTGEANVYGLENDDYAIDIEVVFLKSERVINQLNVERVAGKLANDMKLQTVRKGNFINQISKGYYVTAQDIDFDKSLYPVIVLVIMNDIGTVFEITIDCYDKDLAKGITIANSFQFTND